LTGAYEKAIEDLKVSLFGLHPDKKLKAKALIYLSLSSYLLKDVDKSKNYMEQALELMGDEGFADVELDEKTRGELTGILARFELGSFTPREPEVTVVSKASYQAARNARRESSTGPDNLKEDLESRIKSNPANINNYYDLYEIYMEESNSRNARQTLESLVERHPDEIYAHYLLGLLRYEDRRYSQAEEHFREALSPRDNIMLSEGLIEELRAYLVLSVYQRGDKNRAYDMLSTTIQLFTEEKITSLPLSGIDKALLRQIVTEYRRRS
jgi:tetratricopeptide (TPR) repeat protein